VKLRSCGLTDRGLCRETNEDAYLLEPEFGLFAVADGMGGHAAGEIAAQLATEALREAIFRAGAHRDPEELLRAAVLEANRRICDSILEHRERRGMGTTLVAALVRGDRAVIAHVGDSRAYLYRHGRLRRLTTDHSWVLEQVRLGLLTEEAAARHPMRNIVTRALGTRTMEGPEIHSVELEPGDLLLLCSDGLNTMLSDPEIEEILRSSCHDPAEACRVLVASANERGGEDNTTVVLVQVQNRTGTSR
jgi:protein phosphatase